MGDRDALHELQAQISGVEVQLDEADRRLKAVAARLDAASPPTLDAEARARLLAEEAYLRRMEEQLRAEKAQLRAEKAQLRALQLQLPQAAQGARRAHLHALASCPRARAAAQADTLSCTRAARAA
jgi:predicted  nucleic acid-binding Zn-ribbon protein